MLEQIVFFEWKSDQGQKPTESFAWKLERFWRHSTPSVTTQHLQTGQRPHKSLLFYVVDQSLAGASFGAYQGSKLFLRNYKGYSSRYKKLRKHSDLLSRNKLLLRNGRNGSKSAGGFYLEVRKTRKRLSCLLRHKISFTLSYKNHMIAPFR
jgi:hypothetical protein